MDKSSLDKISLDKTSLDKVSSDEISFVDTTIRDGHQSLWAERMSTGMMLPIAKRLDAAGFLAIELLSGSHVKKAVRELREDPWERIKRVAERVPHTPLRLIAGRVNTFGFDPPAMYELFIERMAANGIRQARISEPWNDLPGWKYRVAVARKFGLDPIVNLIYSVSPVHTDDYYAQRCRQAVTLKPFRLCLKDPGGLLTPERVRTLVPVILANRGRIPVELHSHCTTGSGRWLRSKPSGSASASSIPACRRSPTVPRCPRSSTWRTICARSATSRASTRRCCGR